MTKNKRDLYRRFIVSATFNGKKTHLEMINF